MSPSEIKDLNEERLGKHAMQLFERVCRLYTLSGPINDPDLQPTARGEFDYERLDGTKVRLRMTLETPPPEETADG